MPETHASSIMRLQDDDDVDENDDDLDEDELDDDEDEENDEDDDEESWRVGGRQQALYAASALRRSVRQAEG